MANYGPQIQAEIFKEITIPPFMRLPVSYLEWRHAAREVLPPGAFNYVACGAGTGETMRNNRVAFHKWQIQPRVMIDVAERDLSVTLFGQTYTGPVFLAPIGNQGLFYPDGELASAKAAATVGIPFILSTVSSFSIEEVAKVMGDAPRWFQLYWGKDSDVMASMLYRAETHGYQAIVLTVDRPLAGWNECALRDLYPPLALPHPITNYLTDPVFLAKLPKPPQEDPLAAYAQMAKIVHNPALTWQDLTFIYQHTKLPVLIKGVMNPEDAQLAIDHGISGIIVSNHGGRHLDGEEATLEALPKVVTVVKGQVPVLMDSGIRHGPDVVKAIALGASAVLIGRPYIYGLAYAGELGVKRVAQEILADTDLTMANSGNRSVAEINRSLLVRW